jgi:hypothetical protein
VESARPKEGFRRAIKESSSRISLGGYVRDICFVRQMHEEVAAVELKS